MDNAPEDDTNHLVNFGSPLRVPSFLPSFFLFCFVLSPEMYTT